MFLMFAKITFLKAAFVGESAEIDKRIIKEPRRLTSSMEALSRLLGLISSKECSQMICSERMQLQCCVMKSTLSSTGEFFPLLLLALQIHCVHTCIKVAEHSF